MARKRQADSPAPGVDVDPDALPVLELMRRVVADPVRFAIELARLGDARDLERVSKALAAERAAGIDPDPRLIAFEVDYQGEARRNHRRLKPAADPDGKPKPKRGRGRPERNIQYVEALVRRIVYLQWLGHGANEACRRAAEERGCGERTAQRYYRDLTLRDDAKRRLELADAFGLIPKPKPEDCPNSLRFRVVSGRPSRTRKKPSR